MLYLTQRSPEFLPLMRSAIRRLEQMGIGWEAFNDEAAPGQFELNLAPTDPVTAADWTVRAKRALRDAAFEHDRAVTFMARPFPVYGSGLHLHLSLWRDGAPVFAEDGEALRYWVGGTLATVAGATSICVPTINSFRRQVDFAAVPTTPTWGEDNKGGGRTDDHPPRCVGARRASVGGRRRQPLSRARRRSSPAGWPAWRSASTRPTR